MKIPAEAPVELGEAKVYRFTSTSRQGVVHYVMVFANENGVKCTCEGFTFNKHCRHVDRISLPPS